MKRRTLMILENARKKKRDECDDDRQKKEQETNNENISPNSSFIDTTTDSEIIKASSRVNLIEMERRMILSPINVIAEESEPEEYESLPPQIVVRSSSVSFSSSSSSSSSSSTSSSSSSSSSKTSSSTSASGQNNDNGSISKTVSTKQNSPSTSSYTRLAKETAPSYRISPVNDFESDPDLSDDDPTYTANNVQTYQSPSASSTSDLGFQSLVSSVAQPLIEPEPQPSGSGINEANAANQSKKRQRNPSNWKQNIVKQLRNTGQAYTSLSKSNKEVPARSMKEPCTCHMKCADNIDETYRKDIFDSFWKLGCIELQRMFIKSCMVEIHPKYQYTNATNPRGPNNAFYFTIEGIKIRVCKKFFINTLDITDRQIRTVREKANTIGFIDAEHRGKHDNRKKVSETDTQDIMDHINSIPRIPSHYIRESSTRDYIEGGKTVKDLWRDFNKDRQEKNKPELQYWLYYNIFTTRFNISFFQPKKDKCDGCLDYDLSSVKRKEELQENQDMHITEKTLCRLEKKDDRSDISEENIVTVYDLQAVMQCPTGETSSFYYVSKLNCLNFTMAELTKKTKKSNNSDSEDLSAYGNVFSYFWDETQAKRGANEIGSCILDYLKKVSERSADRPINITFYSDNCAGQNKNKYIACLYAYAVSHFPNIKSITHKFFITGHTQSEGDNVHSLIEKEIKKNLRSGPIYTPHEYIALIKSAKKNGSPFLVQELSYNYILNLKDLQNQWGYNFNEDDDREQVLWNDIKVLRFVKNEPFMLYYKNSYTEERFTSLNMRNKRKKMPCLEEIKINKEYKGKLPLTENKKKGLKELLRKNLIPHYYVDYYNNILSEN